MTGQHFDQYFHCSPYPQYKVAIVRTCTGGVDSDFPFTKENPDFLPFKLLAVMEAEKIIDPEPAAHISENDSTQSTVDMPLETGQAVGSEPITPAPYARTDGDDGYVQGFRLYAIMAALTVSCFLLLLDTSIIVTVGETLVPSSSSDFN